MTTRVYQQRLAYSGLERNAKLDAAAEKNIQEALDGGVRCL